MTEGQASEPPQGTPGRRALGAMESAVRRVRESAGEPPLPPPPSQPPPGTDAPPEPAAPPVASHRPAMTPGPTGGTGTGNWLPERWLLGAVVVVAVLVLAAAVALAASLSSTSSPTPTPPTVAAPAHAQGSGSGPGSHGGSSGHRGTRPSSTPTTGSTPTTASTVPPVPGGPPVISALSPAAGAAGQGIEVAGSNFLSSSGEIVATFNGEVASTRCPAQNTCTVTVPPMAGTQSARVTITTASGTSNAVTFTYT